MTYISLHQRREYFEHRLYKGIDRSALVKLFDSYLFTLALRLKEVLLDLSYAFRFVREYAVFKVKVKASEIKVCSTHDADLAVCGNGFCVNEAGGILKYSHSGVEKLAVV